MPTNSNPLIEVRNLTKVYHTRQSLLDRLRGNRSSIAPVDNVSFSIEEGTIVGLAGESGCGKSTLGELLLALQKPTSGQVIFNGMDINTMSKRELKAYRRDCQIVFQDPYQAMNPRFSVFRTVYEPLKIHRIGDEAEREARVIQALDDAGLRPPEKFLNSFPRELSGGERQRVLIARALVLEPKFIVADEPVSMLDVSVRSGILHLFNRLREEKDITVLYISHDLSTINYLTDQTMIMYLGKVVEQGQTENIVQSPAHPYSEALISAAPEAARSMDYENPKLMSEIPDPTHLPPGCNFAPRCPYASEECKERTPDLNTKIERAESAGETEVPRKVACFHPVSEEVSETKDVSKNTS